MASDCEVRTLSSIGSEIKSWCKQNKVNQTELAAALDVSTMTVRRVWKGTKELTSVQIAIMLEVMPHVTADFFIPTDMGERCIEYAQNLNKGYRTEMQQKAITNIKSKCSKNEDLERRLQAAMNSVMDIEDVKKKQKRSQRVLLRLQLTMTAVLEIQSRVMTIQSRTRKIQLIRKLNLRCLKCWNRQKQMELTCMQWMQEKP